MSLRRLLNEQLRADEGVETCAYQDHLGYWTIGVGRLIDRRKQGAGLRESEIDMLLDNDINDRIFKLREKLPWFTSLGEARQGVLLNMSFQLGVEGLLGFQTTLGLVKEGRHEEAAEQMLKSKWATQTPKRAYKMAEQMKTGVWQ